MKWCHHLHTSDLTLCFTVHSITLGRLKCSLCKPDLRYNLRNAWRPDPDFTWCTFQANTQWVRFKINGWSCFRRHPRESHFTKHHLLYIQFTSIYNDQMHGLQNAFRYRMGGEASLQTRGMTLIRERRSTTHVKCQICCSFFSHAACSACDGISSVSHTPAEWAL